MKHIKKVKVVCINNGSFDDYLSSEFTRNHLNNNCVYDVIDKDENLYLYNDNGYYKERFITLKEYRRKKLEKLNINES